MKRALARIFRARIELQAAMMGTASLGVLLDWWTLTADQLAAIGVALGLWFAAIGALTRRQDLAALRQRIDDEVDTTIARRDRRDDLAAQLAHAEADARAAYDQRRSQLADDQGDDEVL